MATKYFVASGSLKSHKQGCDVVLHKRLTHCTCPQSYRIVAPHGTSTY